MIYIAVVLFSYSPPYVFIFLAIGLPFLLLP